MHAPLPRLALPLALATALAGCASTAKPPTRDTAAPRQTAPRPAARRAVAGRDRSGSRCDSQSFRLGRLSVSQRKPAGGDKCIVMVSAEATGSQARSYIFNSHGMLMTFGMFGSGRVSHSTGARTHFLLPNVQPLRMDRQGSRVLVHTTSGHTVSFDSATGRPSGISGGTFSVTRNVTARHGGGVTLSASSGIVIDFGFMRGQSPHTKPGRQAILTDGVGRSCRVRNRDVLSYTSKEPRLRFSSSSQLRGFLQGRQGAAAKCDELSLN